MIQTILGGMAIASAIYGAQKGYDAKEDFDRAERLNNKARAIFDKAKQKIESQRASTQSALQALGETEIRVWQDTLTPWAERIQCIQSLPEHIQLQNGQNIPVTDLAVEMQDISMKLQDALQTATASGASGVATGFAALGGVQLLASASTGTAISALSGAAATNATLAWLGGAIATGDGGIALGTAVLGGIVAGPAIAVAGWMASAKAEKALANAHANLDQAKLAAKEAELAAAKLGTIRRFANMLNEILTVLNFMARPHMDWLNTLTDSGHVDYNSLDQAQKKRIFQTVSVACTLNSLINTPILDDAGAVPTDTQRRILVAKHSLESGNFSDHQLFAQIGEVLQCGQKA